MVSIMSIQWPLALNLKHLGEHSLSSQFNYKLQLNGERQTKNFQRDFVSEKNS